MWDIHVIVLTEVVTVADAVPDSEWKSLVLLTPLRCRLIQDLISTLEINSKKAIVL